MAKAAWSGEPSEVRVQPRTHRKRSLKPKVLPQRVHIAAHRHRRGTLHSPPMSIAQVPRDQALTKTQFHAALREWLDSTKDARIRVEAGHNRAPWVHVRDGERLFALNADTTRDAVRQYIQLLELYGGDLAWTVAESESGKMTAVAYGADEVRIKPFYLYLRD